MVKEPMGKTFLASALALLLAFALQIVSAWGATVSNLDAEPHVLIVTEGGSQIELTVAAGETTQFCLAGCFVTFPNGDKQALSGSETVELSGGSVLVK